MRSLARWARFKHGSGSTVAKIRQGLSARQVSLESIMCSKAFRYGVRDYREGRAPRFDAAWGNDFEDYEWGRQWATLAPRDLEVVSPRTQQLNPAAVEFFRRHHRDIC